MTPAVPGPALLTRYGGPAPRYTSYPTALEFGPLGPDTLRTALDQTPNLPLSLYLHLPFCRSVCLFCGCHAVHTRDPRRGDPYLDDLITEARAWAALLRPSRPVVQMHWGGGTPTFHPPDALARLADAITAAFPFAPDAELSIEVDPRVTSPAHLTTLRRAGFNRLSLGVQDVDPTVQRAVHRLQPESQTRTLIDAARSLGYQSIAIDLICGLPHQTPASFARTIDQIITLRPDRISIFAFAHLPARIPHQRGIDPRTLPSAQTRLTMTLHASRALQNAGWRAIGMDHFALPQDPLSLALDAGTLHRNFQGYTTHAGTCLLGLGASAISAVGDLYAQNEKTLTTYSHLIRTSGRATTRGLRLTPEDLLRRRLIMDLMCRFALDWTYSGYCPSPAEWSRLQDMADDGLIQLDPTGLRVTATGRFFIRTIARVFDARTPAAAPTCSHTV